MRSSAHEKRERILDAMTTLLAAQGYETTTTADIGHTAGLTPGLVHYYFKSKLDILRALLERLILRHDHALTRVLLAADQAPLSLLRTWITFHLSTGVTQDSTTLAVWVVLSAEALRLEPIRGPFSRVLELEVERVRAWLTLLEPPSAPERLSAAAAALVAQVQGYYLLASTCPGLVPGGSACSQAQHALDGLLIALQRAPESAVYPDIYLYRKEIT